MGSILNHVGMLMIGIGIGFVLHGVIEVGIYNLIQYLRSRRDG